MTTSFWIDIGFHISKLCILLGWNLINFSVASSAKEALFLLFSLRGAGVDGVCLPRAIVFLWVKDLRRPGGA